MEYTYSLTVYYDDELFAAYRFDNAIDAVDAWNNCFDFGDAKQYATYNLSEPNGKMYTKNFYRNGKVTVK